MNAHEIVALAIRLHPGVRPSFASTGSSSARTAGSSGSPWITVHEAAKRARCGSKLVYREVRAGRLRAVRVGGRRELRLRSEWIDAWLLGRVGDGA
jgi:excisionase family DNA binding protein